MGILQEKKSEGAECHNARVDELLEKMKNMNRHTINEQVLLVLKYTAETAANL